jgi:anaerobic magnesium-protoporphyrin IX monomethyl ester cyclase
MRLPDEPWGQVRGLSYRNLDGDVVHNPSRILQNDVESIAWPAYSLFKIDRYTNLQPLTDGLDPHARAYTLVTSRGCPYQCIYCSKPITGHTWRARSPADVVAEWRYLVDEMGATEIGITDDVWNLKLDRAKEICRLLISEGLTDVPWITVHGMRADHTDAELFRLMKQAGCLRAGFGVESGNQMVLDSIKKQQSLEDVRRAFREAKAAGLQTMGFFIFGLPADTEETMEDTIRFALELDPDLANFMIAAPYPGTELWEIARRDGRLFSMNWQDYAIHDERARYDLPTLPPELVERKWHEAYRRFYLRPSRIWRKAVDLDTWRRLPEYASNFGRFFLGSKAETEG